jgi:hypothetical protein
VSDHVTLDSLPRELAELFRPRIADAADEVLAEINRSIPIYDQPYDGSVAHGVQQAIAQFVDRLADPDAPQEDRKALFRELGRQELMEGRTLDELQSAYRIGARVAWRRMSRTAERANVPISTLCLLGEAIFAYIDELSALSIEGYTTAQAREAGSVERHRRGLLKLILAQPPSTMAAVATAAASARWVAPEHVFAVALEPQGEARQTPTLHANFLVDLESNAPCLVVSESEERHLYGLADNLTGWRAAIGPRVPTVDAARSLDWARETLALVRQGILPDQMVTWCTDHLVALWLSRGTSLGTWLAEQALSPLADLPAAQRDRLSETLLAWLKTRGNVAEVAGLLDVHPQTVRNRLHQLAKLFGNRLGNPDDRFEMEIALRATTAR